MSAIGRLSCCIAIVILLLAPLSLQAGQVLSITTCQNVIEPDLVPVDIQEKFNSGAPEIHAVVKLADMKAGSVVKGSWVSVDAIATPNYEIDFVEKTIQHAGEADLHLALSRPDNGWPTGNYKVEIYIDGKLSAVKTFSIAGASPTPQAPPKQPAQPPAGRQTPVTPQPQGGGVYSGTFVYTSDQTGITLDLSDDGRGSIKGTLVSTTGGSFVVEGIVEEGVAMGTCYDNSGGVFFEAYLDGNDLYLGLIEPDANNMPDYNRMTEFMLTRKQGGGTIPSAPRPSTKPSVPQSGSLSGGAGSRPQSGSVPQAQRGRAGNTYRHPVGFSFWYPSGWTLTEHEAFTQLTPPNPGQSPEGPTELYFLLGSNVADEGIFTPDDQRIISFLDEQVRSVSPVLQYTGRSTPVNNSQGKGALLEWEGKTPKGDDVIARSFVSIINDHGIGLIGIGFRDVINGRDKDLRQMFGSFGFGQGQNDPAIVGSWSLVSTSAIDNQSPFETSWSRAQAVSEDKSILVFNHDGTWSRSNESHTLVGAGGVWLEDKSQSSSRGSWNAGDGVLYMVWEDNSWEEYKYVVEQGAQGRQLRLAVENRGEVWVQTD